MKKTITLIFVLISVLSNAQFQKDYILNAENLKSLESIVIDPDFVFSSVSVSADANYNFEGVYIIADQDTFWLQVNDDAFNDSLIFSSLVVFSSDQQNVKFYGNHLSSKLTFHFLNAYSSPIKAITKSLKTVNDSIEPPVSISQEVWRAGLPDPDYERIVHEVQNLIVHHSAGSNIDTNYTNVIRNIYLYHTQTLKWSDIGYNYLIAQNGQLYDGRDPGNYEQDNIKGAHFCGSNNGTMGICILGNYEDAYPTSESLITLSHLLAWKALKDNFDIFSVFSHPLNSELNYISGHRDGCATLCPGEHLYNSLPEIRFMADSIVKANSNSSETMVEEVMDDLNVQILINYQSKIIDFVVNNEDVIQVAVYDSNGKIKQKSMVVRKIDFQSWLPGLYVMQIRTDRQITNHKLMLF